MKYCFVVLAAASFYLFGLFSSPVLAQENDAQKFREMSIEELMDVKITVASSKPKTVNRSAGIVTLITSEDIARMGARDLVDVLQTVPGFYIGQDTVGAVGAGFRGMWAFSGKSLYLLDGHIMNEGMYETTPLSRRFPMDLIDRIEIIRGPGSVRYGGTAELAVIKITTKLAARRNSALVAGGGMQEEGTVSQQYEGLGVFKGESINGGAIMSYSRAGQSENNVTDSTGFKYNMQGVSDVTDRFAQAQVSVGKFNAQVLNEVYVIEDQSGLTTSLYGSVPVTFESLGVIADYNFEVSPALTIQPFVNYKRDRPWMVDDVNATPDPFVFYDRVATRIGYGLNVNYDPTSDINLLFGVDSYENEGQDQRGGLFTRQNDTKVKYHVDALFAEMSYAMGWADLTAGVRYDKNRDYDSSLVPRLALLNEYGRWGYKVILSQAYRNPSLESGEYVAAGVKIQPETTSVAELELNYKPTSKSLMAVNFFTMEIDDSIVYDGATDSYQNFSHVGVNGVELNYQYRAPATLLQASYSYNRPDGLKIAKWSVPGHDNRFLGVESWKANLQAGFQVLDRSLQISPSLTVLGSRYSYEYSAAAAANTLQKEDETYLANIVVEKKEFFHQNLSLSGGIYNLIDEDFRIFQPYDGGKTSISGSNREYFVKLSATF